MTTAADLAPVFWPAPGTRVPVRPQPARDSGTGTITMPRLTDTGELRAATETIIAGIEADAQAWNAARQAETAAWLHERGLDQ